MTFSEYQAEAMKTAVYPRGKYAVVYPALGLTGEAGEVAEKVKKVVRDHGADFGPEAVEAITRELGDVLWYIAAMADDLGISLDRVAETNIAKLRSRAQRDRLHGSGDDR